MPRAENGKSESDKYFLGIDLGGTKIGAGVVARHGKLLSYVERPTEAFVSNRTVLTNIEKAADDAVCEAGIELTDISFTGLAIPACPEENGEVLPECPNLPRFGRVRIKPILMKRLQCKVALENDANCFVLGEWIAGVARDRKNVVGITLGTGLGVGLLVNGQLYRGKHWKAGQIWDQPMPSGGIFENGISGRKLAEEAGFTPGMDLVRLARGGDTWVHERLLSYVKNVDWLLSFLGRLLDPELFVLGGSLAAAFDLFDQEIESSVRRRWDVRISKLGHRASVIGAALLLQYPYPEDQR